MSIMTVMTNGETPSATVPGTNGSGSGAAGSDSDSPVFHSVIKAHNEDDIVPVKPKQYSFNMVDRFSLKNKVCVVTGALGGIGRAICIGYAQMGGDVVVLDKRLDDGSFCKELKSYGVRAGSYGLDVTDMEATEKIIDQIITDFGTIDVFVANAGIPWYYGPVIDESASKKGWDQVIDINVNSLFYCSKYVGRHFKQQNKGSLIITASMSASIVNIPEYKTAYNISKAAAKHMAKSLAVEWAFFARVNSVSPGYCDTPLSAPVPTADRARWWGLTPMGREGLPEEMVGAYVYLACDASSYTTGADLAVDGGYTII